ncbi:MAG: DNA repair and recombination protein RadB [Nanoarchaeota archaeon]|nr:DNA repair and recombination protein RadB [Nanoarchaeota archaeon]MBU1501731.1 DNA repair and recombination protein RadB [Nanoarchaeota archaeon]MBU2459259.1 DNA repair and recombination protein RadB [Nanoarchaeota archaeon]
MTEIMEKISAGSFDLNKWLYGGYESGVISMIAGPPASGKTNFVILAACSQAKKGKKVIFIDTEGGFSPERVRQIVGDEYEKILENLFILNPTNFEEQKKIFLNLLNRVKKESISLIVVDGMAMLYRLELGSARENLEGEDELEDKGARRKDKKVQEVNSEVAKQMRILAEISRKELIPILITNQVYNEFLSEEEWKRGVKPEANIVGGDLFKYWSKTIIELKNDGGKRKAILLKHRSIPLKEMSFEIRNEGVFRKGWI